MSQFVTRSRLSIWLLLISLIISAAMMRPGFATLAALGVNAVVLVGLRMVSKLEAKAETKPVG